MEDFISVYRWEHSESGIGPYNHNFESLFDHTDNNHPVISQEENLSNIDKSEYPALYKYLKYDNEFYLKENFKCGFSTIEQMKKWFNKNEIETMLNKGFVFFEYKVDIFSVVLFTTQVIFNPENVYSKNIVNI